MHNFHSYHYVKEYIEHSGSGNTLCSCHVITGNELWWISTFSQVVSCVLLSFSAVPQNGPQQK